jgi:8-oxo-dGTP diphosphatase
MISVVHAVIIDENNKLLLLKRSPHLRYAPGQWCWPGGRIEEGESGDQALQREMQEEIGTEVEVLHSASSYELSTDYDEWRVHSYLCKLQQPFELQGDEHSDSSWVFVNELENYDCAKGVAPTIDALREHLVL